MWMAGEESKDECVIHTVSNRRWAVTSKSVQESGRSVIFRDEVNGTLLTYFFLPSGEVEFFNKLPYGMHSTLRYAQKR